MAWFWLRTKQSETKTEPLEIKAKSLEKTKLLETAAFSVIKSLTIATKDILGSGSFGTVYGAEYNGKPCVAKVMHEHEFLSGDGPTPLQMCVREINTLSLLRHPSIVQFLGAYFDDKSKVPILVMERMWNSLTTLLEQMPNQLPLLIKTHILYDVACGLQYLHGQEKPVVHRDLNAKNILVNENLEAKIADLGQAKVLETFKGEVLSTKPGNLAVMPPEALEHGSTYGPQLDIFSFGCNVIHLVTEQFPNPTEAFVKSTSSQSIFVKESEVVRRKEFIDLMAESDFLQELSQECLKDEPSERPNAFDVCSSLKEYFKQLELESPNLATQLKQNKFSLMQVILTLEAELNATKILREVLTKENNSLQINLAETIEANKKNIAGYNSTISKLKAKISATESTVYSLSTKNCELENEKENFIVKNNDLISEVNLLQEQHKIYEQKNSALESEKVDLIAKINNLNSEVDYLQEQVEQHKVLCMKQQQEILYLQSKERVFNMDSHLHARLLESLKIYENEHQQLQQQRESFNKKDAQLLSLKKKCTTQQQLLEEKSIRLSTMESSLIETCKSMESSLIETCKSMDSQEASLEERNSMLSELLEKKDELHAQLHKECSDKDESLRRKESEIKLLKKEHADDKSNILIQHIREIQGLKSTIEMHKSEQTTYKQIKELINNEDQYKSDLDKNTKDKVMKIQNELEHSVTSLNEFKRQIDCHETNLKEMMKQAEIYNSSGIHSQYSFKISWFSHLSLPVKRIRSSAILVKEKVFITGGYCTLVPQDNLDSYLKSLERGNEVFCFHTGKCGWDAIASPVVLGGVASVNGQCVLVSGAEGNTLTGNVYVLCEEGSDEQWKKFSEPVPTPRILPCVCCYGDRWLIVCGGYACKEGTDLLEAVNVVEILDITKKEWHTISEEQCPNAFNMLCCAIVNEDFYVIGGSKILKCNLNKLITAATKLSENDTQLWSEIEIQIENLHPFSVVDVNGESMIIASFSGSEDDVTCVLMKDTTDTWRKMSETVECQHCSAVVVTPTLELLLFGGSEIIAKEKATCISQCGSCTPTLTLSKGIPSNTNGEQFSSEQFELVQDITPIQFPAVSFTGPIHTKQFDHKGGTFQSSVHKVSIVVPPNAIDDGEKVTVHMGATTSGPFDLPEDCKLRSAVVWLGSGSDVVLKRSIAVVVPHSAVFTSPQHHSMMRFLTCEDCEGPRYKFDYSELTQEIYKEKGLIELNKTAMVAIVARSECYSKESDEEFHDTLKDVKPHSEADVHNQETFSNNTTPSIRYLAKLLWPGGQLPNPFVAHVYCLQDLPTVLHKVNTQYRRAFYDENTEILETKLIIDDDGTELKCVLPCSDSSECDCLSGWEVDDISEMQSEDSTKLSESMLDPMKFLFSFSSKSSTSGHFEFVFQGAKQSVNTDKNQGQLCVQKRHSSNDSAPFIIKEVQQEVSTKDDVDT